MPNPVTSSFDFSTIDLAPYLPGVFNDNPLFADYLNGITSVWQESVLGYVQLLSNIRQTTDITTKVPQEIFILIRNANILGYKFISNFMNQQDYLKLVDFISRYYELEGTKQFANFLGYVKGAKIEIDQLWSRIGIEDYTAFFYKYEIDKNNTIISNPGQTTPGTWYPTSHKRISYDLLLLGTVTGPIIGTFESTVKSLFYTLAPIHWVLEQIVATIEFESKLKMGVKGTQYEFDISITDLQLQNLSNGGDPLTINGESILSRVRV